MMAMAMLRPKGACAKASGPMPRAGLGVNIMGPESGERTDFHLLTQHGT